MPEPNQFDIFLTSTVDTSLKRISFVGNPYLHINRILPSAITVVIFPKAKTNMKVIIGAIEKTIRDICGGFPRLM